MAPEALSMCTVPVEVVDSPRREEPPAAIRGTRVLVVDDNATNRRILGDMLAPWDLVPSLAASADEAWQMLSQARQADKPYELVLVDADMPNVDGFTLAAQIRSDPQLCKTVMVMLSSGERPGEMSRCEELKVASYLLKPVKPSEMEHAINVALGRVPATPSPSQEAEHRHASRRCGFFWPKTAPSIRNWHSSC